MNFLDELSQFNTIFIDTAPIIYYIEAHHQFGPIAKIAIDFFQSEKLIAFSSVITLTEVLPKPFEVGDENLVKKFTDFLKYGENLTLIEISTDIAEKAGKLRGEYPFLRALDAIQIATAFEVGADAFLTNDKKLKQIEGIKILILKDYLRK